MRLPPVESFQRSELPDRSSPRRPDAGSGAAGRAAEASNGRRGGARRRASSGRREQFGCARLPPGSAQCSAAPPLMAEKSGGAEPHAVSRQGRSGYRCARGRPDRSPRRNQHGADQLESRCWRQPTAPRCRGARVRSTASAQRRQSPPPGSSAHPGRSYDLWRKLLRLPCRLTVTGSAFPVARHQLKLDDQRQVRRAVISPQCDAISNRCSCWMRAGRGCQCSTSPARAGRACRRPCRALTRAATSRRVAFLVR